jgi:hypothetical protein
MPLPTDYLDRRETAAELTRMGLRISPWTLDTMATRGGGPAYVHFGRRVLYRWQDVLAWVEQRTSPACSTQAEHKAEDPRKKAPAAAEQARRRMSA